MAPSGPSTTDYGEIQQNEVEALRSIFMDDFQEDEVKKGAWNVRCILKGWSSLLDLGLIYEFWSMELTRDFTLLRSRLIALFEFDSSLSL